jgi:hypothetical protein
MLEGKTSCGRDPVGEGCEEACMQAPLLSTLAVGERPLNSGSRRRGAGKARHSLSSSWLLSRVQVGGVHLQPRSRRRGAPRGVAACPNTGPRGKGEWAWVDEGTPDSPCCQPIQGHLQGVRWREGQLHEMMGTRAADADAGGRPAWVLGL